MLTSVVRASRVAVTCDEIGSGRDARTRVSVIRRRLPLLAVALVLHAVWLEGCVSYKPRALEEVPFRERAETLEQNGLRVSAAALGRSEARDLFGVPLGKNGIQPLWLEIENGGEHPHVFFQQSVDPDYFSPSEAAYKSHYSGSKRLLTYGLLGILLWPLLLVAPVQYVSARRANSKMDDLFVERGIGNRVIVPGEHKKGFVFTHLDEGTKHVTVGLLSHDGEKRFDLFVQVPGLRVDHERFEEAKLYPSQEIPDLDWKALRDALVDLPCCTTNKKASSNGDPLNLVVVGSFEALLEGLTRAGWDETEVIDVSTSLKTVRSFVFGSSYRHSPVSNLYLFDRPQDVAFQKARETVHERNHLRLWLAPFHLADQPVWVGQVSRDIGVKFTTRAWNLTTHAIDGDIDDSRENVMGDLIQTGRVERISYVPGVGPSDPEDPPENLTGDEYVTDGHRAVAVLSREKVDALIWIIDEPQPAPQPPATEGVESEPPSSPDAAPPN
jgi:hypothetical protein